MFQICINAIWYILQKNVANTDAFEQLECNLVNFEIEK